MACSATTGPRREAKRQIVEEIAGTDTMQKIKDAGSRLKKHPNVPADARLLIGAWHRIAFAVAERLLRERVSTQGRSARQ
jgi:hypothetical protein